MQNLKGFYLWYAMSTQQWISCLGVCVILLLAYLCSKYKRSISWKLVFWGITLQFLFAFLILKTDAGNAVFSWANDLVINIMGYQEEGARFLFHVLAIPPVKEGSMGFFFAFQALTTVVFFSALISVLYYLGIMQVVIVALAKFMKRFMGTSGAETLSVSANIFVGQTEAPLVIKPYVKEMTRSELLCVMVGGMATVSGGILGAYIGMLSPHFPKIAGHLLAASVMSAPAALLLAKIILPEREESKTSGSVHIHHEKIHGNVIEAIIGGMETGIQLAINVGGALLVFIGLIALLNALFEWSFGLFGLEGVTMQLLLGYAFSPLAWVMGVPWEDCHVVGQLLGEKTVLNEVIAYAHMGQLLTENAQIISERSMIIASYALCGFANFLSIGIQVGGIGAIAPSRKPDLARLGVRALIGGTLAACLTGTIVSIMIPEAG